MVYITNKDETEAKKIAKHLLDKKLIACANVFPISSVYKWKGKLKDTKEVVAIVKTKKENFEKIITEIKKVHSYECPCVIKIDVESNKEFENWVMKECQ
jgi:periplasmic divalent cation tolerance protein